MIGALFLFGGQHTAGLPAAGHAGGARAAAGLFVLLIQNFWATLLLLVSITGFAVYASLASKYALQKAMYLAWDHKLGDLLVEKLMSLLNRLWPGKPSPKEIPDATMIKSELREAVKQDQETPKIGKRILNYWLKKVSLDDIDFRNPNQDFKTMLIQKLRAFAGKSWSPPGGFFCCGRIAYPDLCPGPGAGPLTGWGRLHFVDLYRRPVMKILWKYLRPHSRLILLALLLAGVGQLLTMIDPIIFGKIIDDYANNAALKNQGDLVQGVLFWLFVALAVALLARLARTFQEYVMRLAVQRFGMQIFNDGLRQTLRLSFQEFEEQRSGKSWRCCKKYVPIQSGLSAHLSTSFFHPS